MERRYEHLYKNLFGMGAILCCFLLLSFVFWLLPAGAQTPLPADTNREEFESRIETFFGTLRRGSSTSVALDEFLRGSPLGASDANTQSNALRDRIDDLQQFGNIVTWEKLEPRRIGTHIVLARYVLVYDQYPVIWTFVFYRKPPATTSSMTGSASWVLIELHFDTHMKNLL